MKIGILGLGVVGSAVYNGFYELGHDMSYFDPVKEGSKFGDVLGSDICFICVPTPPNSEGFCDTSIVEESINKLNESKYKGIAVIKSTVTPGTTQKLADSYPDLNIAFVPEFLRERCAEIDFVENHDVCIIGAHDDGAYEAIKLSHGKFPEKFVRFSSEYRMTPASKSFH